MGQNRKRKPARSVPASSLPAIIAVCENNEIDAIRSALKTVNAQVLQTMWRKRTVRQKLVDALAVIMVAPLPIPSLASAIKEISEDAYAVNTPIFILVPDDTNNANVKKLYSAGAKAVFEWPREAFILSECLLAMTRAEKVKIRPTEIDRALEQTGNAHLRLFRSIARNCRIRVNGGTAYLSGVVDCLSDRFRTRSMIERIPGIEAVDISQLTVEPTHLSDGEMKKNIRAMLRCTAEIDETTYWVKVKEQAVTIEGIASDAGELRRIRQLIANLKGVQDIRQAVQISPGRKKRDHANVTLLKDALRICYPKANISISVFDGIAVLSGKVTTAADKRKIETLALEVSDIKRVVSKIAVPRTEVP